MQTAEKYQAALNATAVLVQEFPFLKASAVTISQAEYEAALELVEYLIDNDDDNPLIGVLADKIEAYENTAPEFSQWNASLTALPKGVAMLGVIMDQNNLNQSDFKEEIGGKSLVSMIMKGERQLTLDHMRSLSRRFGIPVASFID
ncbi:helix-turn-helix domain-containing protein [Pantoea sp. PNT02]|nr:helix-turn-helix domain-containing protein [Pantoea sp. PNT02]